MYDYHNICTTLHTLIAAQLAQSGLWRVISASTIAYGKSIVILWFLVKTLRIETLDRTTLHRLYVEDQLTIRAIADRLSLRPRMVYDAMIRWRIPRRSHTARQQRSAPNYPFDEATLRLHYADLGQTINEAATQLNVSRGAVLSAMRHWQIPRRRSGPKSKRQPPSS